jgi:hypothetical protein
MVDASRPSLSRVNPKANRPVVASPDESGETVRFEILSDVEGVAGGG